MSEAAPVVVVPCPSCGRIASGNYCIHCGANILGDGGKKNDPYLEFADGLVNFSNIWYWLKTLSYLVRRPTANTIRVYNEISFTDAIKFLELSVAFYLLSTASRAAFQGIFNLVGDKLTKELVAEGAFLLYIALSYILILKLFYWLASKRFGKRDKREYLKMYCIFAGFLLPFMALLDYFTGSIFSGGMHPLTMVLRFATNILILLYAYYVWEYFWNAPGLKVVSQLLTAFGISFVIGAIAYFGVHAIFGVNPGPPQPIDVKGIPFDSLTIVR